MQWLSIPIACFPKTGRSDKMNNQSKCCEDQLDSGIVKTVVTLKDVPLEVRKKLASKPLYFTHL